MANKRESHHSRYSSLPTVNLAILSGGTASINDDEKQISSNPQLQSTNTDTVTQLIHVPNRRKNMHKKSASLSMSNLKKLKQDLKSQISSEFPSGHTYNLSANMIQNLKKYNEKEQQDLISIQTRLCKWIGSEKFVTLDKFIDLMDTIASHVSVQQATDMFNQMDPSNNGQIQTSLLLHDEFLPRMILNLFEKEHSRSNSMSSLPDDFNLQGSDFEDDENYEEMNQKELIQHIKTHKQESRRLKEWIMEVAQPALGKYDELQMRLDDYEAEQADKQSELLSFKTRVSEMDDLQRQLKQTQSHTMLLKVDNDSLMLSVNESAKKQQIEHNKYNESVREAVEYKKLAKELQEINDRYRKKTETLNDKQNKLEEENQNLRQLVLEYETENTKLSEWQQMMEYKQQMDEYKNENQNSVKFYVSDEDSRDEFRTQRKRRMTLKNDDDQMEDDDDTFDENYTLDSEIQNTGVIKGRSRRNTIRAYYEVQQRRLSYMSLPSEEQLKHEEEQLNNGNNPTPFIERQDSVLSTMSKAHKDDSDTLDRNASMFKTQQNIFESAVTEELRIELRKKIEQELHEDYELKLKQRDIELQMKLHKEKILLEDEHRKYKEYTAEKMD
eukprot:981486_1